MYFRFTISTCTKAEGSICHTSLKWNWSIKYHSGVRQNWDKSNTFQINIILKDNVIENTFVKINKWHVLSIPGVILYKCRTTSMYISAEYCFFVLLRQPGLKQHKLWAWIFFIILVPFFFFLKVLVRKSTMAGLHVREVRLKTYKTEQTNQQKHTISSLRV